MSSTKKRKPPIPKVRRVWKIKPATRVKPSAKHYRRPAEKRKKPSWVENINWFGDEI